MSTIRQGSICINEKGELGYVDYPDTNYVRDEVTGETYEAYLGYVLRGTHGKGHRAFGSQWRSRVGDTILVTHVDVLAGVQPAPPAPPSPLPAEPTPRPGPRDIDKF